MLDDRNNPKLQILIAKYLSGILSDNDVDLFNRLISNDPKYLKYLNDFASPFGMSISNLGPEVKYEGEGLQFECD